MTTTTRTLPTVDIVFDGPPAHKSGRFVEVEIAGRGTRVGDWEEIPARYGGPGLWALRIPNETMALADLAQFGAVELTSAEPDSSDWHRADGLPWTITVEGAGLGWAGSTADEAIFEAWRALAALQGT